MKKTREEFRSPPVDSQAEEATLGMMMLAPYVANQAALELPDGPAEFHSPFNAALYFAIAELVSAGVSVTDPTALAIAAKQHEPAYSQDKLYEHAARIFAHRASVENVAIYARRVHECYVRRRAISALGRSLDEMFDESVSADEACQHTAARVDTINELIASRSGNVSMVDALAAAYERLTTPIDRGEVLSTGFEAVDNLIFGLGPAQLTVIGARASRGKTALGMSMACHVAITEAVPTLVFSLEMTRRDLLARAILSRAGVNEYALRARPDDQKMLTAIEASREAIANSRLFIRDGEHTIDDIINVSRLMARKESIKLVVVDYLSLVEVTDRFERTDLKIGYITRRLKKRVAEALGVHVLLLAQLNRKHESEDRAPRMSDFRDSDMIAHDADKILLPWQPTEKPAAGDDESPQKGFKTGKVHLIVDKHRNGATGSVELWWQAEYARFVPFTNEERYLQYSVTQP